MREATRGLGVAGDEVPMALWGLSIGVWCRQLSFEDQSWEWGTSAMRATKTRWMLENFLVRRNSSPFLPPRTGVAGARGFVAGVGGLGLGARGSGGEPQWVQGTGDPAQLTSAATLLGFFLVLFSGPFFWIPAKGACLFCNLPPNRGDFTLFQLGHAREVC